MCTREHMGRRCPRAFAGLLARAGALPVGAVVTSLQPALCAGPAEAQPAGHRRVARPTPCAERPPTGTGVRSHPPRPGLPGAGPAGPTRRSPAGCRAPEHGPAQTLGSAPVGDQGGAWVGAPSRTAHPGQGHMRVQWPGSGSLWPPSRGAVRTSSAGSSSDQRLHPDVMVGHPESWRPRPLLP